MQLFMNLKCTTILVMHEQSYTLLCNDFSGGMTPSWSHDVLGKLVCRSLRGLYLKLTSAILVAVRSQPVQA